MLAIASYNLREYALEALKRLELLEYFDYIVIEITKQRILNFYGSYPIKEDLFIDDNPITISNIKKRFPKILAIIYGLMLKIS